MRSMIGLEDVTVGHVLLKELGTVNASSMTVEISERDISRDLDSMYGVRSKMGELVRINGILADAGGRGFALEQYTARIAQVAVDDIAMKLGLSRQIHPALEKLHDRTSGVIATRIAVESVSEVIKNLGKRLLEWMKNIWTKIKAFFARVYARLVSVKNNVAHALKLAKEVPANAKMVADTIKDSVALEDLAAHRQFLDHHLLFGINGRCDFSTTMEIVGNTATLIRINREIIVHIVETLQRLTSTPPKEEDLETSAQKLVNEIKEKMHRFTLLHHRTEGNKTVYSYGHFHASEVFTLRVANGLSDDDLRVRLFNVDLSTEKIKSPPYEVKTLSVGEMSKLAVETMRLVEQTEDYNKVIPIVEKVLHHTSDVLQGYYNKVTTDDARETITDALNMIHDMFSYVCKHLPSLSASAMRVAADSSTYVRASVARHKVAA